MTAAGMQDEPRRRPEEAFMVYALKKHLYLRFGNILSRPEGRFDYKECPIIYPSFKNEKCKTATKEISKWGTGGYAQGRGPHDATVTVKGKEKQMAVAADVYLDALGDDTRERLLGDLLCKQLMEHGEKIGLKQIIWNGVLYPVGGSGRWYYKAKEPGASASEKHTNHLHIEFKPEKANKNMEAALLAALGKVESEFKKKSGAER